MERPLLNDKDEYPSDEVLARVLGRGKPAWDAFTARLATEFPDATIEWRFYNDGKSWLGKLARKKKTICWVSIWDQFFRTTFYFTDKNDQGIARLPIAQSLKDGYRAAQNAAGKLKPLSIETKRGKALEDIFVLIGYKIALK